MELLNVDLVNVQREKELGGYHLAHADMDLEQWMLCLNELEVAHNSVVEKCNHPLQESFAGVSSCNSAPDIHLVGTAEIEMEVALDLSFGLAYLNPTFHSHWCLKVAKKEPQVEP